MVLVFRNCGFYDMLREGKVPLSVVSNEIINHVLEFIKKNAVANCDNICIIEDDKLT